MAHQFHIPVLGLGYSIDTPLKVARYGISSVVSIVDDELIERMRKYHLEQHQLTYVVIPKGAADYRSKRITAYLDLLNNLITAQFELLKQQDFSLGSDICRYFELLPEHSQLKQGYDLMMEYPEGEGKRIFQQILRQQMQVGTIDVNIMAKVDKLNFGKDDTYLGDENTDALAALRGFAKSNVQSSVILSAGMNPRLYGYLTEFEDFYPDENGELKKKIILKVSDFRSAFIQSKFLAKKGLWVSEFRIESGLNCGGHAFATEGYLLGPILEEFKQKKAIMITELYQLYTTALTERGNLKIDLPKQRLSVQGGIGTATENEFLFKQYQVNSTGWGSPFLLVPEVTNVDDHTLGKLTKATENDFYLSNSSPLGVLFNNFKGSGIEEQRLERMAKGRPGSPCTKKYLCTNTEFTTQPICTASREYQNLKLKQLETLALPEQEFKQQFEIITEKICLCEGLCTSTYIKAGIVKPKESKAVAICPGPNLAYFSNIYSLDQMVNHIYGKADLLAKVQRPHFLIKELNLYIDYLQTEIQLHLKDLNDKKQKQLSKFKTQLLDGIDYYKTLFNQQAQLIKDQFYKELLVSENVLNNTVI
ncbi:hypothetical protein [Pedobacter sp. Hv1]|uniref:hypothetical protein n=1 Tax=Pedobacter sp. Hv1 TaxID=1740090 RepID=UPI0006D897D2|nr:hypothetical protein [Pedobacter sp. Hv1]KQC00615.1 hypothetical protein AQF98_07970 [Pedobacter sp. Hv1]